MRHYAFPCERSVLGQVLDLTYDRGKLVKLNFMERGRYYLLVIRLDPKYEDVLYGIMKERTRKNGIHATDVSEYWRDFFGERLYT